MAGAVLVSASFAFRGHALDEPRLVLGALVIIHTLGLAFWLGAFAPLARAAASEPPEVARTLAHDFGLKALWVVCALIAAGALILVLLGAATPAALNTAYGQAFAVKLAFVAGVLFLSGLTKMRLTPALQAGSPDAGIRLRRSIRVEAALVGAILLTTAAFTTLSSPPQDDTQTAKTGDRAFFVR